MPDTKLPAELVVVIQVLLRLATLGNILGYSGGTYAAFRGMKITPAGLSRQAETGMVCLHFS